MTKHDLWEKRYYEKQNRGKNRALFIGIDYKGSARQLKHAVFDAKFAEKNLIEKYNWKFDEIRRLNDYRSNPKNIPTRQNIINSLQWLVHGSSPGDVMFLHISCHGVKTNRRTGILPIDFDTIKTYISSKVFYEALIVEIPKGATLYAVIDTCHSEGLLQLPYKYDFIQEKYIKTSEYNQILGNVIALTSCTKLEKSEDLKSFSKMVYMNIKLNCNWYEFIKLIQSKFTNQEPGIETSKKFRIDRKASATSKNKKYKSVIFSRINKN